MGLIRSVDAGLLAILSSHFRPVLLIEADWHDGINRLTTAPVDIVWDGHTWTGAGWLVDFEVPTEGTGATAESATVHVAATLEAMLAEIGTTVRNKLVTVWLGTVTDFGAGDLQAPPLEIFSGYVDGRRFEKSVDDAGGSHDMAVDLGVGPSARTKTRYTHSPEDQQVAFPGDTAGRHLAIIMKFTRNPPQWPA